MRVEIVRAKKRLPSRKKYANDVRVLERLGALLDKKRRVWEHANLKRAVIRLLTVEEAT